MAALLSVLTSVYEPARSFIGLTTDSSFSVIDKLDKYYRDVKSTVLNHQHSATGLFPVRTNADCKEVKIRDSVYCAASAWALALAYRRLDDDKGRTHELEHCAIKCMRGILFCYMRQSETVESFKKSPTSSNCLPSVFNIETGEKMRNFETYGHLQIDALALFLLYMVEMISSGLQIIYNTDEVTFIQNLVYCLERSYRTPDFGMWERGSKYNNGSTELHSSSIGLAKAVLESISGFNLFGNQGCSWSVICVDFDAHNRNLQTLNSLLPRESRSHNTDSALLPCISYPAFAVDDDAVYDQTMDKIVRKLKGKHGFKRFLRDGYRSGLEDRSRWYYKPAEIKLFDGIECEFPLFYIYMIIDGVFREKPHQVETYQNLLKPLILQTYEGYYVIPKYYYVPSELIDQEKEVPGSQRRYASNSGRDGKLFLWAQALYLISELLVSKLISPKDLDPVGRYIPQNEQRSVRLRYSNQSLVENDLVVHVALIAESQRLQVFLNTYGIQTQTPHQVEPIQIWPQQEIGKAYSVLGVNKKLKLTGRPKRPIGYIGTSLIYRILGKTVVCFSLVFDLSDFYMSQDVLILIDDIKNSLQFMKQSWKMNTRPLYLVLIREDNIKGSRFNPILDMLASFKKGNIGGVKVRVDRLQTLIAGATVEQLDFLRLSEEEDIPDFVHFKELEFPSHSRVKRRASAVNIYKLDQGPEINMNDWKSKSTDEILHKLEECKCLESNAILLSILMKREGPNFVSSKGTIADLLEKLYWKSGSKKHWSNVRYTASILGKQVDSLAPSITRVLVQGKQVTIGVFGQEEEVISNPLTPAEIKKIIYAKCSPYDEREAVIQQELIIHIGWAISNNQELFNGMLKIRIGWILHAMKHELKIQSGNMPVLDLYKMSPSDVKQLFMDSLQAHKYGRSWINKRHLDGSLNRTPKGFYDRVWAILERTQGGIVVSENHLPQQPTLSDMTMYEMNFSLLVEGLLKDIVKPEYRQIIVELLMVISIVLERNPEVEFHGKVNLDELVQESFENFKFDKSQNKNDEQTMTDFYNTPPTGTMGTSSYLAKTVTDTLLKGEVKLNIDDPCMVS
ncbi:phosphorylase b kinase regulatory subunit beta isoform X3 [Callorhinchus milii]|uniref:phosphorylase b kinase regulatory subunit beta isoform X3 n=1 Tax=Callorhinchus milii TaxID=7868 RepID=UPI001C3F851C|nr:phosphorylase b kinase regulatory subunit beta isoform X3 [Callorhinchus milii]